MWNRVVFLSVLASIGVISATLCAPALPFIADRFSADLSYVQFTISLFLVGNAFGQFLSGPLSDRIGQRTTLLGGLSLYIVASSACALSNQMSFLLIARFFQGMGSAAGPVLSRAIATSSFPPKRSAQVQSYGAIGVGIASMLAILLSGRITLSSWRGNFWLATVLGGILFLWAWKSLQRIALPHRGERIRLKELFAEVGRVVKHPLFFSNALCHSLTYGLMYGYIGLFPFFLMEIFHEKNPVQVGLYSAYMIGFYMVGAFFAARLVLRWASNRLIAIGLALQLLSGMILILPIPPALFLGALFIFNLSIGVILPMTAANALTPFVGQSVGAASSSLGLFYRFVGSLLSTLICQFPLAGGRNLGIAIASLSLGSLFFLNALRYRTRLQNLSQ